jgi:hypothetical protein
MSDSPVTRDIKNHCLFEVATEVANRGETVEHKPFGVASLTYLSRRHLLSH